MPVPQHSPDVVLQPGDVRQEQREGLLGQRGTLVWLTGLSGAGKSTIAHALEARLFGERRLAYVLDGDNLRHGLNADLGFSDRDREENIRRVGEVGGLFVDAGLIAIAAFISPFRRDRERVRAIVGSPRFIEVFLDVPLAVCESRDPKHLYAKARRGEIAEFTGISSPYEAPEAPDVVLRTADTGVDACVDALHAELVRRGALR
ncbi:MAG TPA: adenylyl-sulfate kinase [Thermoanaerobaculia bacterium]|nr:adenylyl-sulfate kinase [Thermoanaerobaculia bacterium]